MTRAPDRHERAWNRRKTGAGLVAAVALLGALADTTDATIVVRHVLPSATGANEYDSDLTRAYEECTAPNDASSDGIPACNPPLTSACDFDSGTLRLRPRLALETEVTATLRGIDGPGTCTTGTYSLRVLLRVSVDDEECIGGTCTVFDIPLAIAFDGPNPGGKYDIDTTIETVLHSVSPGMDLDDANYEILSATVQGPDGLPMAGAGVGMPGANNFYSNLGASYPECTVPNDDNNTGIPVCAPAATWAPACDTDGASVTWHDPGAGALLMLPAMDDVAGSSPDCSTGAYQFESTLRITTADCGGAAELCTLVDTPVVLSATPTRNDIHDVTIPFTASGLTGPMDNVEVLRVRVLEPASSAFFLSAGVANARRLGKPQVQIGRKKLEVPNDDQIKIQGRMLRANPLDPTLPPGVTITVNDHAGPVYVVTIPNNLWEIAGADSWRYKDKTGALNGVRKATLKFGDSPLGSGYQLKLVAKDLDLSAATYPGVDIVITAPHAGDRFGHEQGQPHVQGGQQDAQLQMTP